MIRYHIYIGLCWSCVGFRDNGADPLQTCISCRHREMQLELLQCFKLPQTGSLNTNVMYKRNSFTAFPSSLPHWLHGIKCLMTTLANQMPFHLPKKPTIVYSPQSFKGHFCDLVFRHFNQIQYKISILLSKQSESRGKCCSLSLNAIKIFINCLFLKFDTLSNRQ